MKFFAVLFVTILSTTAQAYDASVVEPIRLGALEDALAMAMNAEKIEIHSKKASYSILAQVNPYIRETARFNLVFSATSQGKLFVLKCVLKEMAAVEGNSQAYQDWIEIDATECKISFNGQPVGPLAMIGSGFNVNSNPGVPKLIMMPLATLVLIQRHYDEEHPRRGLL